MRFFITGEILGRIWVTQDSKADLHPDRVAISENEWETPVQTLQVIDVTTKEPVSEVEKVK